MAKAATPADIIREVIARTCGRLPVRDQDLLASDLDLNADDWAELLVALEISLRCEAGDIAFSEDLTVADLIEALKSRAR